MKRKKGAIVWDKKSKKYVKVQDDKKNRNRKRSQHRSKLNLSFLIFRDMAAPVSYMTWAVSMSLP